MEKSNYLLAAILIIITVAFTNQGFASNKYNESNSRVEITETLNKWAKDFNDKNIKAVCGLFASDLVFTHQGFPVNRNYQQQCQQIKDALIHSNKQYVYEYEPPKIEDIIVEGNLASVTVVWTLKTSSPNSPDTEISKARSLDIFKRQPDGSWKIVRYLSFTEVP